MYVANHLSSEQLKRIAKQQSQAKLLLGLQAVVLAQAGHSAPEIAKILSVTYRTVQYWIQRYNRQGLDGLKDLRRGGNQRKLTNQQEQQIKKYLDYQADDPTGGVRRGHDECRRTPGVWCLEYLVVRTRLARRRPDRRTVLGRRRRPGIPLRAATFGRAYLAPG